MRRSFMSSTNLATILKGQQSLPLVYPFVSSIGRVSEGSIAPLQLKTVVDIDEE